LSFNLVAGCELLIRIVSYLFVLLCNFLANVVTQNTSLSGLGDIAWKFLSQPLARTSGFDLFPASLWLGTFTRMTLSLASVAAVVIFGTLVAATQEFLDLFACARGVSLRPLVTWSIKLVEAAVALELDTLRAGFARSRVTCQQTRVVASFGARQLAREFARAAVRASLRKILKNCTFIFLADKIVDYFHKKLYF
jgi:hypothetical protein